MEKLYVVSSLTRHGVRNKLSAVTGNVFWLWMLPASVFPAALSSSKKIQNLFNDCVYAEALHPSIALSDPTWLELLERAKEESLQEQQDKLRACSATANKLENLIEEW